jgi:hypothetical protein
MLRASQDRTFAHAERVGKKAFSLEIDISEMPRGGLRFSSREFIEQAAKVAEELESIAITPENAEQWGFLGRGDEAN